MLRSFFITLMAVFVISCGGDSTPSSGGGTVPPNSEGEPQGGPIVTDPEEEAVDPPTDDIDPPQPPVAPEETVNSARVIFETGMRDAPGIAGSRVVSFKDSHMSKNGWVAIGGSYQDAQGDSGKAIWRGLGGELSPILKTTEGIEGLAANSWFEQAEEVLILEDSSLWAIVKLGGGKSGEEAIVKIDPSGSAKLVLESGGPLLSSGPDLTGFRGMVQDGDSLLVYGSYSALPSYLFKVTTDGDVTVIANRDRFDETSAGNHPSSAGCHVLLSTTAPLFVSETAAVAFEGTFRDDGTGTGVCNDRVIVTYRNGLYSVAYTKGDPLPIDDGSNIFDYSLLAVTADGDAVVKFVHSLSGDDPADSIWKIDSSGNKQLIVLSGEIIPTSDTSSTAQMGRQIDKDSLSSASGNKLSLYVDGVVLKGTARTDVPYSSFFDTGVSQLERVVGTGVETVPGLDERSSFKTIEENSVYLDDQNSIWFVATASDVTGERDDYSGLWYFGDNGNSQLAIPFNNTISADHFKVGDDGQVLLEFGTIQTRVYYGEISR